eukprot:TRINITY_DN70250_c0_g1_i1.p1 TRINITY_DN70250_c0_g1~~TRINITY_DN70250_c0_g1_i1.p1  ORF type:complete len:202 (+),score=43.16 TRINITY_DN70250_c0_g1_i1:76-681(+)
MRLLLRCCGLWAALLGADANGDDSAMWLKFEKDLDKPESPIKTDPNLRLMLRMRCQTWEKKKDYPRGMPRTTVDRLCAEVLDTKGPSDDSVGAQLAEAQRFVQYGCLAVLVLGLILLTGWWIWQASDPDGPGAKGSAAAAFTGAGAPRQSPAQPAQAQPPPAASTPMPAAPLSEAQKAEQRNARMARFNAAAGGSSATEAS